jgi:hypothetical protein
MNTVLTSLGLKKQKNQISDTTVYHWMTANRRRHQYNNGL